MQGEGGICEINQSTNQSIFKLYLVQARNSFKTIKDDVIP